MQNDSPKPDNDKGKGKQPHRLHFIHDSGSYDISEIKEPSAPVIKSPPGSFDEGVKPPKKAPAFDLSGSTTLQIPQVNSTNTSSTDSCTPRPGIMQHESVQKSIQQRRPTPMPAPTVSKRCTIL